MSRAAALLERVPDPEIPVLSVVDLGIVRDVEESADGRAVRVVLTPTYSGCPATQVIVHDVRAALATSYDAVDVEIVLSPAWTTDWLSDEGRRKLAAYGIAPPGGSAKVINFGPEIPLRSVRPAEVDHVCAVGTPEACPRCGSPDTEEIAEFGSTPCKALWRCLTCREPFDYFKTH